MFLPDKFLNGLHHFRRDLVLFAAQTAHQKVKVIEGQDVIVDVRSTSLEHFVPPIPDIHTWK